MYPKATSFLFYFYGYNLFLLKDTYLWQLEQAIVSLLLTKDMYFNAPLVAIRETNYFMDFTFTFLLLSDTCFFFKAPMVAE